MTTVKEIVDSSKKRVEQLEVEIQKTEGKMVRDLTLQLPQISLFILFRHVWRQRRWRRNWHSIQNWRSAWTMQCRRS